MTTPTEGNKGREIKFRAQNFGGYWRYSDKCKWGLPEFFSYFGSLNGQDSPILNQNTLGQSTGMKDKHGKDIYEDDVVRMLYTDWPSNSAPNNEGLEDYLKSISKIGRVVWDRDRWMLNFGPSKYGDDDLDRMEPGPHGECEVIGNIHDSPNLTAQSNGGIRPNS